MPSGMTCCICRGTSGIDYTVREMNMGTREPFPYWECATCGCIQIVAVPENLAKYYPDNYYSFSMRVTTLQLWLYRVYLAAPHLGQMVRPAGPRFQSVLDAKPPEGARILDVGSGSGKLISILRSIGFDAEGIDPFLREETTYVRRANLEEIDGGWDLIMFHHSLEHTADNVSALRCAGQKLSPGGTCLVRIPVAAWTWQHYRENWVQLDAPRHLVIHSLESFRRASQLAGLELFNVKFDSTGGQFRGSELYQRDIPMNEWYKAPITKSDARGFERRAVDLNSRQLGDSAAFFLRRPAQ